eukprot:962353-Prorocentrum_minimum.AAC.1
MTEKATPRNSPGPSEWQCTGTAMSSWRTRRTIVSPQDLAAGPGVHAGGNWRVWPSRRRGQRRSVLLPLRSPSGLGGRAVFLWQTARERDLLATGPGVHAGGDWRGGSSRWRGHRCRSVQPAVWRSGSGSGGQRFCGGLRKGTPVGV